MEAVDDGALIAGFLSGSAESTVRVDRWIGEVLRHRRLRLGADVEDVAQDVRRRLLLALRAERFRGEASLRTYVWRVAQAAAIDHLRRRARRPAPASLDDVPEPATEQDDPETRLEQAERRQELLRIWRALGEECRRLWALIVYEELPYAAIADRLGLSEGNVKVRALRCRRKAAEIYGSAVTPGRGGRLFQGKAS